MGAHPGGDVVSGNFEEPEILAELDRSFGENRQRLVLERGFIEFGSVGHDRQLPGDVDEAPDAICIIPGQPVKPADEDG